MVQGFAELEYGMLRYMGAIDDSTPIVTSGKFSLSYNLNNLRRINTRHVLSSYWDICFGYKIDLVSIKIGYKILIMFYPICSLTKKKKKKITLKNVLYDLHLFLPLSFTLFSVHDEQLVDDIPIEKLLVHDVPVDIICTPTRVIFTNTSINKI